MRIVLIAYACNPTRGSEPGAGWNWALSLARAGVNIFVLTRRAEEADIANYCSKHDIPSNLSFRFIDEDAVLLRAVPARLRVYGHYLAFQVRGRQFLQANQDLLADVDVVHHVTWGSLTFGSQFARLGRPFVWGPLGGGQLLPWHLLRYCSGPKTWELIRNVSVAFAVPLAPHTRVTAKRSSTVVATNSATARQARRIGARTARLFLADGTPSLPDTARVPRRLDSPSDFTFVWLGRMFGFKGVTLAIEAFAYCLKDHSDSRLILVGDGPARAEAERAAADLGITSRVSFVGRLSWEDTMTELACANAHLFTSLRDSSGAPLLEAAAAGLASVALAHHGADDFLPADAGTLVSTHPASDLAARIGTAMADLASGRTRYEEQDIQRFAQLHSWPSKAADMISVYEELGNTIHSDAIRSQP